MVNKNKVSKKMFAILLAIILVLTTFPVGFASVFAASKNEFSVEIKDYSFSAKVTLTDETDPENTQTETATNGKALFSDFVDDTKKYNLQITDLYMLYRFQIHQQWILPELLLLGLLQ